MPPGGAAGIRPSTATADRDVERAPGPFRRPGSTAPGAHAEYDVIVVGGGPAGTETARRLAASGRRVLVVEEHLVLGEPVQCAGLIATNVFPLIGLDPHGPFHQQDIDGGHIVSPSGRRVLLKAPEVHAHAVSRAAFDQALAARAEGAGVEVVRGALYVDSSWDPKAGVRTVDLLWKAGRGDGPKATSLTCRALVGADGVGSEVARTTGFLDRQFVLSGLEVELEGIDIPDPENVHVHTGSHIAPGYFAWIVPKGPHGARVGLCVDIHRAKGRSAWDYYQRYLQLPDVARLTAGGKEVYRIVGCIPLGLRERLAGDGVGLVGDAGGFAKPTSGGGIYMACWGALHLADVLEHALATGDTSALALAAYDRRVRRSIGRELRVGAALHRVFRTLTDEELDRLAAKIDHPGVLRTINRHGDIDHPSRLVVPVVARRPSLLRYAAPAARELLRTYVHLE